MTVSRGTLDPALSHAPGETSPRYRGWRVVAVCFVMAIFCWTFGFYGQGVYLAELQRLRGWPASVISTASTLNYLFSALLVIFVSNAVARLGIRLFLIGGVACLGSAAALVGWVDAPWQLYIVYMLMSFGWAAMSAVSITTLVGVWFRERRGLAISLALAGASFGGIVGVPALLGLIARFGFAPALLIAVAVMMFVLLPMILVWVGPPPSSPVLHSTAQGVQPSGEEEIWTRRRALRSLPFWTVAAPFALGWLVQVGFLVHQIALLEPKLGGGGAGLAVAVTTMAALVGRLGLALIIDKLDQRVVSAGAFLSQAGALVAIASTQNHAALWAGCAVFGFSVGNLITLPALIIHREFDAKAFTLLVGLATAIGQFTYAFGPGLLGVLRDAAGGYHLPLVLCAVVDAAAATIVLVRGDRQRRRQPSLPVS